MKIAKKPRSAGDLDAASIRLLEALAQPGAYAWTDEAAPNAPLRAVAPRNGVSVQIGSFSPAAATALVARGLAGWRKDGRARLHITDAGRANRARADAPADVAPFTAQHADLARRRVAQGDSAHDATVNLAESPLAWLARRKGRDGRPLVDAAGFEAGERLRRDLTFAAMLPRLTANWEATPGDPAYRGLTYSDRAIAARQRVDSALTAVGPEFSGLLVDVCGFLKGIATVETERGWPARSGKVILGFALQRLARHYGYASEATGEARAALRHWGEPDFRPQAGIVEPDVREN